MTEPDTDPGNRDPGQRDPSVDPALPTPLDGDAERLPALPLAARLVLLVVGWLLLVVGIAGLFLPGLQGCVTIVFAAAVLSLASEMIYLLLRRGLDRWPKLLGRVEQFRGWMHSKVSAAGRRLDRWRAWWRAKLRR